MRYTFIILIASIFFNCSNDLDDLEQTLENNIVGKEIVLDNVIACAASIANNESVSVFLYPREGATDIKCYQTNSVNVDKNDWGVYTLLNVPISDVFNGYLMKFDAQFEEEKWVVVTFEEEGKLHISNPIRLKHISRPTQYLPENVSIQTDTANPTFTWQDGLYTDSNIYFQVLANSDNSFISGTYTVDQTFTFYNLDNVVLNITEEPPLDLQSGTNYSFNLMGVSEDNWVNLFVVKPFVLQY